MVSFHVNESLEQLKKDHTPEAIQARLRSGPIQNYLRDFIYGAIDGTVTTFALISGVAGAGLGPEIIIVLGMVNLIGDGFSMAASNFLGIRAEEQMRQRARSIEENHISVYPDGEREEIRQIYLKKGITGEDLERIVDVTTSDVQRWVDTMLHEELGMALNGPNPLKAAMFTFIAFLAIGVIPLSVFICQHFWPGFISRPYFYSILVTGLVFFSVGAAKSWIVQQRWYWSGLETLGVGGGAAALAYGVGLLLKGVVNT